MAKKYNILSKSDMNRMARDMQKSLENAVKKELRKPMDYICPNCGRRFRISAGSNRCPGCGQSVRLNIN